MTEALLFLLGFSSVVGVYEVVATGKGAKFGVAMNEQNLGSDTR